MKQYYNFRIARWEDPKHIGKHNVNPIRNDIIAQNKAQEKRVHIIWDIFHNNEANMHVHQIGWET